MQAVAYVLTREYLDGSGFEVLRVYLSRPRAELDRSLTDGDHGLTYKVHEVLLISGDEK